MKHEKVDNSRPGGSGVTVVVVGQAWPVFLIPPVSIKGPYH